jgi:hypothetical protein
MRPPRPQAIGAVFGWARETADATAPTAWHGPTEKHRTAFPNGECHGAILVTAILPHLLKRLIDQKRPDRCMVSEHRAQGQMIGLAALTIVAAARS